MPAAALALTGILISGAGAVIRISEMNETVNLAANYDPADYLSTMNAAQASLQAAGREQAGPSAVAPAAPPAPAPAPAAAVVSTGNCKASYYAQGQGTASGETFDPSGLTAANKTLPFNSKVRVTNVANGKSVTVRINDRGPYVSGRCLSLSKAAFAEIASLGTGVVSVKYEVLAATAT